MQRVTRAVVGEQAEGVGGGAAPGCGEGEPGAAVVVEGVGALVDGGGLAGDGVGHFPLVGWGGDEVPGPNGPGIGVKGGDGDALDAGFGDGGADVVAIGADGEVGAVDGPGPVTVRPTTATGRSGEFCEKGVAAVVRVIRAALKDKGALAGADVTVAGSVEDMPAGVEG